ncbi:hypothetical protein [Sulfitobacter guttiformis]|uniref:17 kDa surface antigen n=1 Tax=Sulfitobacter guttiformis TaxID=74349 RepID=A0A420DR44_9RHOB|nr:hypothetical protein [Sulfitobacter guttiformis]KIN74085.1 hypothetical protein Z949_3281 [Sulfitobacter guttiformis KCTC 32187]RKE96702.1 hypothetical protein C8N30_1271 [Sulfitobacter guttiformis]
MKKFALVFPLIAALGACATPEGNLAATTLAGAALGATVSGSDDKFKGAIIGGGAGLATGAVLNSQGGGCTYQRPDGSTYKAVCP